MSTGKTRPYVSKQREEGAEATRAGVLHAAQDLFVRRGIDAVTIAEVARKAGVSVPTVYAHFKSKEGILRALMKAALFGPRYRVALERLKGETDAARLIELTAAVARSIYEGESAELGLLRGASAFSIALRKMEREFETMRFDMQEERVRLLFAQKKARKGLTFEKARQILWMYTSREIYRLLVQESGWTPDQYQEWLSRTLLATLVELATTTS